MRLLSRLQPDSATQVGILTAVGVYLIYQNALPSLADLRMGPPNEDNAEMARRHAAWKSAGLITIVFLVARDLNSYIIGGAALVGLDYMYKHNNAIVSGTKEMEGSNAGNLAPSAVAEYPLPS